ncbi:hypothetical protein ON010_g3351 [Phytophthora cinnamomi]|nr:hypothetical protein ON010_g3351 [Phytophthora cinnamomi]
MARRRRLQPRDAPDVYAGLVRAHDAQRDCPTEVSDDVTVERVCGGVRSPASNAPGEGPRSQQADLGRAGMAHQQGGLDDHAAARQGHAVRRAQPAPFARLANPHGRAGLPGLGGGSVAAAAGANPKEAALAGQPQDGHEAAALRGPPAAAAPGAAVGNGIRAAKEGRTNESTV